MLVYSALKSQFENDVLEGAIDEKVEQAVYEKLGHGTGEAEMRSWRNSLLYMSKVLDDPGIPDDAGIAIEYGIPYTPKRIDMIISGLSDDGKCNAVVVELKQWTEVGIVRDKDGIVETRLGGYLTETTHPSYQAWTYVELLQDFNQEVQDSDISLIPCACLHNYPLREDDPLLDEQYADHIKLAPIFAKHDTLKLREFIKKFVRKGDRLDTVFRIDQGKLRPAKSLQDCLLSMVEGNEEFTLIDDQKVVYEEIMAQARRACTNDRKHTIIVRGGPGTGKSVLAINALASVTGLGMSAAYVTRNAAPRQVYSYKLKGSLAHSKIDNLFKSSGAFTECPENTFDVLICDESHRLNEKSGLYSNRGENQIKEIINSSRLSVFFIDEDQQVILKDIGTVQEITKWANRAHCFVTKMDLVSQFRCNGSDGYPAWLNDVLEIHPSGNTTLEGADYDFRVFDDPAELRREITRKNLENGKSRMVAGYCWNWITKNAADADKYDIVLPGFAMKWNLNSKEPWAVDEGSIDQIGCIHTCQGLEFDYIGVIIGPDMIYRDGTIVTDAKARAKTDASLKGLTKRYPDPEEARQVADRIIKNTYKVLMTRGMKGCYVYCTDTELSHYMWHRTQLI